MEMKRNEFYDSIIREMDAMTETPKVDFKLLCRLQNENSDMDFASIIAKLEMQEIPLSEPVRQLGICAGVLYA